MMVSIVDREVDNKGEYTLTREEPRFSQTDIYRMYISELKHILDFNIPEIYKIMLLKQRIDDMESDKRLQY
jgi:hypothetical protein